MNTGLNCDKSAGLQEPRQAAADLPAGASSQNADGRANGDEPDQAEDTHPADPNRRRDGTYRPGHVSGNRRHGGRALQLHGPSDALSAARFHEIRDGILQGLGGESEAATPKLALVDRLAEAMLLAELLWRHLAAVGPLTASGRTRAATTLYWEASRRVERLAIAVGLERRARRVDFKEFIEGYASDAD